MRKVKIKGLPNKAHGGPTGGAADGVRRFMEGNKNFDKGLNQFAEPDFDVNKTLKAVDPSEANIEAEHGEIAVVPGMGGIPESYKISGNRHADGGVPLNLAPDSFIFSDHKKGDMKLKDKDMLAEFGMSVPKKGRVKGHTFADIANKFDLNEYKKLLLDPNSDDLERETAERMIQNYNLKLGKLALVQESKKGFPQEIPAIAMPYLESIQADPNQFASQEPQGQPMQAAYGAGVIGDPSQYSYGTGGENKRMAKRFNGLSIAQRGGEYTGAFWNSILQDGGAITMEEQIYGTPSDVTFSNTTEGQMAVRGQDKFPMPAGYEGDFYHYDYNAEEEGNNPYSKTFGDRFRNTTKMFQPKRRIRQTTQFQDGGNQNAQAMYDYMAQNKFADDQITVGKKEHDLTQKKYKPYHYTGKFKGKDQMRPFVEGRPIPTDSIADVPGIDPSQMRVHWSKSGKPTPVGPGASEYIQEYGNYYSKGLSNPEIFPSFTAPEQMATAPSPYKQQDGGTPVKSVETVPNFTQMSPSQRAGYNDAMGMFMTTKKTPEQQDAYRKLIERLHANGQYNIKQGVDSVGAYYNPPVTQTEDIPGYQDGGPINEADYITAQDAAANAAAVGNNYVEGPQPEFVEPDVWNREIGGTKASRKRLQAEYLFSLIKDAEAAGLNEDEYVNYIETEAAAKGLDPEKFVQDAVRELSPEELETVKDNKFLEPIVNKAKADVAKIDNGMETSDKPTKRYNLNKNDKVYDSTHEDYKPEIVKKGDYIRKADGELYKATGKVADQTEYEQLERVPEGNRKAYSRSYALLNKTLTDPANKEMTDAIYEKYQESISKGKIGDDRKKALKNMSKEDVIKNLMRAQEQIYAINAAAGSDPELLSRIESGAMDTKHKVDPVTGKKYQKNEMYADIAKGLGYDEKDLMTDDEIAAFQGAYQALGAISKDDKYKENLKNFNFKPVGVSDQEWEGDSNISPVDDWFGNTTIGQAATAKNDPTMAFEKVDPLKAKERIAAAANPNYVSQGTDSPWWAQDVGNMAMAVGERARLKKYLPHSFPIDLARPDVLYYDPSRALAANAEQAKIAGDTLSSFSNSAQAAAQMSGIQGNAFAQGANTLADYENKNVSIGNQYLANVKATQDQQNQFNAQRMQKLFDQTTIANQQFDNSVTASNRNIFEAWRQGLTNAKETEALDLAYEQFDMDPARGGGVYYNEFARPLTGQGSAGASDDAYFAEVASMKNKYPDLDEGTITAKLGPKYGKGKKQPYGSGNREDLRRFVEDQQRRGKRRG